MTAIVNCVTIGDFEAPGRYDVNVPLSAPGDKRDARGIGFVADFAGKPSFGVPEAALTCVTNLTHQSALDAGARTGDGPLTAGSEAT